MSETPQYGYEWDAKQGVYEIAPLDEDGELDWGHEVATTVSGTQEEQLRWARLIVKAPDMLEAIRKASAVLNRHRDGLGVGHALTACHLCEAERFLAPVLAAIQGEQG